MLAKGARDEWNVEFVLLSESTKSAVCEEIHLGLGDETVNKLILVLFKDFWRSTLHIFETEIDLTFVSSIISQVTHVINICVLCDSILQAKLILQSYLWVFFVLLRISIP